MTAEIIDSYRDRKWDSCSIINARSGRCSDDKRLIARAGMEF